MTARTQKNTAPALETLDTYTLRVRANQWMHFGADVISRRGRRYAASWGWDTGRSYTTKGAAIEATRIECREAARIVRERTATEGR
jgi:hypothetical protein